MNAAGLTWSLLRAASFAAIALLAPSLLAQAPPKVVFSAEPHPPMAVKLNGYGAVTYFPDRLVVHVRQLQLSGVGLSVDVIVESLGLEAFTPDGRILGKAERIPVRKPLAQRAELLLEKLDFTVPMAVPKEDFIFFLVAYMPDDASWITKKIELPGLARVQR